MTNRNGERYICLDNAWRACRDVEGEMVLTENGTVWQLPSGRRKFIWYVTDDRLLPMPKDRLFYYPTVRLNLEQRN